MHTHTQASSHYLIQLKRMLHLAAKWIMHSLGQELPCCETDSDDYDGRSY